MKLGKAGTDKQSKYHACLYLRQNKNECSFTEVNFDFSLIMLFNKLEEIWQKNTKN